MTPFPPRGRAFYVVFVLLLVTLSSYLDRQLPALLVKPIKQSFSISDTQFSLLQGWAFAVLFAILGVPFGRLVDRTNRRNLIIVGLSLWSVMSILAGLSMNYSQLFLTRIGVGIGEACLAPAAYSMVADCFAPHLRARAISAYYLSLSLGSGASMLVGSLVLPHLPAEGVVFPIIGLLPPWKMLFILVGLPGLALVPLLLTIREPVRRESNGLDPAADQGPISEFLAHVARHRLTFACVVAIASTVGIIGYANLAWAPTFFDRTFGVPVSSSSWVLGLLIAFGGLSGTLASGLLSDRWAKRRVPAARFRVTALACVILLPSSVLWTLMPTPNASYAVLAVSVFASNLAQSAVPTIIQEIVPNRMRGQAVAGYLLIAGLLALGCGPTMPALLTDHVFHDEHALGAALALMASITGAIGIAAALIGLRPYERSWTLITGPVVENESTQQRSVGRN